MRETLHRSENLVIARASDPKQFDVEIRFSSSSARGTTNAICPRCGVKARPSHWELEGPDGANTMWFSCSSTPECAGDDADFSWSQPVKFKDWVDKE